MAVTSHEPQETAGAGPGSGHRRVLLTGATGSIGWEVAGQLAAAGIPTLALVRDPSRVEALPGRGAGLEHVSGSPGEAEVIRRAQAFQPTTLIHCAWRGVAGRQRNEAEQITENIPLTLATISLARESGCRHWIGLGSQAEYGNPNTVVDEDFPTRPTTNYGRAKLAAGILGLGLCETWGMTGTWLRVFSTYGPRDSVDFLLPYLIAELLAGRRPRLTKCEQRWDYLYVSDAAEAVVCAVRAPSAGVFNVGSGEAHPLKEIVELSRRLVGTAVEPEYGVIAYRPDQVMHLQADIRRLTTATGWTPRTALETGLRHCVESIRQRTGGSPP